MLMLCNHGPVSVFFMGFPEQTLSDLQPEAQLPICVVFLQKKSTEQVLQETFAFTFSSLASFDPHGSSLQQVSVVVLRVVPDTFASHLSGTGWITLPCSGSSSLWQYDLLWPMKGELKCPMSLGWKLWKTVHDSPCLSFLPPELPAVSG